MEQNYNSQRTENIGRGPSVFPFLSWDVFWMAVKEEVKKPRKKPAEEVD